MKKEILLTVLATAMISGPAWAQKPPAKDDSAAAHVELAANYYQAGRLEVAAEELQKVLDKEPRNAQANNMMGLVYMKLGNLAQAESYLKTSLAADPASGNTLNNMGMLLCQTRRHDAGMESLGRALSSPRYTQISQTLVNGGICLQQKGDLVAAEKFLLKALEHEAFMPAALFQLAKVYYATQRYPQAESRLAALHKQLQPNAASTYLQYQLALAQGKPAESARLAALLQSRFPESAESQNIKLN